MAGNGISGRPHDRNGPMVDCPLLDDFIHANNFPRTSPQNFNLTDQVSSVANVATQLAKNSNSLKLRVGGGRRREGARGLRRLCVGPRAALGGILGGVFGKDGDTGESTRQMYSGTVTLINKMEPEISTLSDSQLRERTSALQERARNGDSLDSLLPEAFAVVREASKWENSRPSPFSCSIDSGAVVAFFVYRIIRDGGHTKEGSSLKVGPEN